MPLAFLAFAISVAYLPDILSSAVAPRLWVLLVGAPLVLLSTSQIKMTRLHWLGLVVLTVIALSSFWSISRLDTYMGLSYLVASAMVFCAAAEQEDLTPVWLMLGFASVLNSIIAIQQWWTGPGAVGVGGLFYHQDFFGAFAAMALVALFAGVRYKTPAVWFLIASAAVNLALSGARGAILAAVAGLLAMMLLEGRFKRVVVGLMIVMVTFVIMASTNAMHPRVGALAVRWVEWKWIADNLHPLGWGWNTLGSIFPMEHADNDYVEVVSDLGVLAILPFAFIILVLRRARHAPASFVILTVALVNACVSSPFYSPATLMVSAVCLGALCNSRAVVRQSRLASSKASGSDFILRSDFGSGRRLHEA